MGAEERERPSVFGELRESFTEEELLELTLEQWVDLRSALGEREKQTRSLEAWEELECDP